MNEKLSALFNRIKADNNLLTVSEAQTSQGIVLPILNNLGWDVFDTSEVTPEYSVSGGRVDFAYESKRLCTKIRKTVRRHFTFYILHFTFYAVIYCFKM